MRNSDTKQWLITGDLPLVSLQTPLLSHYSTQVCVCLGESREISQRGLCSHRLPTSTWKASGEGRSITFVCRPWKKAWEQQNPRWSGASFSLGARVRKRWEMFITGRPFLGLSHLTDFVCRDNSRFAGACLKKIVLGISVGVKADSLLWQAWCEHS